MGTTIRPAAAGDAAGLADIYNHYVANTWLTFEERAVDAREMEQRRTATVAAGLPWLVAEASGGIIGFAYAARWKERDAYHASVESTIYLDPGRTGTGVGRQLYAALLESLRAASVHSVVGGISLPNEQSVRLHERLGFRKVAHFEQIGYKFERWIDVGYWQLLL